MRTCGLRSGKCEENWKGLWQPPCRARGRLKLASRKWLQSRKLHFKKNPKMIHGCIVESHESTGQRVESSVPTKHEGHIAGKVFTSMSHLNLVHNFSYASSNEHSGSRGCRKGWKKLVTIPAWQLEKVQRKKKVMLEAQREKKKVHFATLMDICHLKNAELESKLQKYTGRVVLRGDVVKDDSGAYAVFTEQGSSASQMTAAK